MAACILLVMGLGATLTALIYVSGRLAQPGAAAASPGAWIFPLSAALLLSLGLAPAIGAKGEVRQQLAAGKILVSSQEVQGTCLKRGEVMGVIDTSPEIVWRVVTDLNNFKDFMPRTINSMAVAPEKIPLILQSRPSRAAEVERLLGPIPANPANSRLPGGKYTTYLYSNLKFPWPCNNRWYIIKGLNDETRASQHCYRSSWTLVTGNLKENSGEWLLEPFTPGKTKVIYRLLTDPGGAIPQFLVDRCTENVMPQIIKAVRKRADKLAGRQPPG
jgi:ribosome-associated toxin RatA of RatAB toxin-antitoxin module